MNFTVRWSQTARNQLAAIWVSHHDRAGVTAATHLIDTLLGRDPENAGEERPPNRRILFQSPLVVIYRVDTVNRRVIVSRVRQY